MPISNSIGRRFVAQYHYAVICPPITKLTLGLFDKGNLVGVALWGYGTRPRHTIKKLFPSLDVEDYLELNRLCVLDSMPRNTESLRRERICVTRARVRPSWRAISDWEGTWPVSRSPFHFMAFRRSSATRGVLGSLMGLGEPLGGGMALTLSIGATRFKEPMFPLSNAPFGPRVISTACSKISLLSGPVR
jgi:hypothetical protein